MFSRGTIKAVYEEEDGRSHKYQTSFFKNELKDGIEHLENFGFSSKAEEDADALSLFSGGNREKGVIVVISDPTKKPVKLKKGESLVYASDGAYIHLKKGQKIEFIANDLTLIAKDSLTVKSPKVIFDGEVEVTKDLKAGGVSLVNHKHVVPNAGISEIPTPEV